MKKREFFAINGQSLELEVQYQIQEMQSHTIYSGFPLILIRGKDLQIRVFHNVCSHRGFKLLDKTCNLKNVIRCPYHSWSYDFEGNLVATPHIGGLNIHNSEKFDKIRSQS